MSRLGLEHDADISYDRVDSKLDADIEQEEDDDVKDSTVIRKDLNMNMPCRVVDCEEHFEQTKRSDRFCPLHDGSEAPNRKPGYIANPRDDRKSVKCTTLSLAQYALKIEAHAASAREHLHKHNPNHRRCSTVVDGENCKGIPRDDNLKCDRCNDMDKIKLLEEKANRVAIQEAAKLQELRNKAKSKAFIGGGKRPLISPGQIARIEANRLIREAAIAKLDAEAKQAVVEAQRQEDEKLAQEMERAAALPPPICVCRHINHAPKDRVLAPRGSLDCDACLAYARVELSANVFRRDTGGESVSLKRKPNDAEAERHFRFMHCIASDIKAREHFYRTKQSTFVIPLDMVLPPIVSSTKVIPKVNPTKAPPPVKEKKLRAKLTDDRENYYEKVFTSPEDGKDHSFALLLNVQCCMEKLKIPKTDWFAFNETTESKAQHVHVIFIWRKDVSPDFRLINRCNKIDDKYYPVAPINDENIGKGKKKCTGLIRSKVHFDAIMNKYPSGDPNIITPDSHFEWKDKKKERLPGKTLPQAPRLS